MSETEKNPKDMSTVEIQEEIEVCYESLNTLLKLTNQKMKLGGDIGGGIGKRIGELKLELGGETMKISKEDFETVAKFITIMKKYDSEANQWNVAVGGDVVHDQDDQNFNRFVYVNGNMVELGVGK